MSLTENSIKKITHKAIQEYAAAGFIVLPLQGKIPGPGWNKAQYELDPDLSRFPGNFGAKLVPSDLVIDVDPRNFKSGDKPFKRLCEAIGIDLKTCGGPVVKTGGGGFHFYFKIHGNRKIKETLPEFPGIEFKSKGRQVVGYGSTHPDTGKAYELISGSLSAIPLAPESLMELIYRPLKAKTELVVPATIDDSEMTRKRYIEYLKSAPIAVQGESGDNTTFAVACKAKTFGLSPEMALELLLEYYDPKCQPPWGAEALEVKVRNAYAYASGTAGEDHPAADFTEVTVANPKHLRWDYGENGQPKKTINNCVNYFFLKESELMNLLAYNEFTDQIMMIKPAPWILKNHFPHGTGKVWSDEDTVMCRYYLSQNYKFDISRMIVDEAVVVAAKVNSVHPVRNWMESLVWDERPRLDTWLIDYLSVKDTPYTRTIGAKTLIGAVNRIWEPGCQFDYMLVLEGEQGTGKSTVCKILGGPWYGDIILDPHNKDTVTAMQKCMILEVSEMQHNTHAAVDAVKSFITRKVDIIRAAYARHTREIPRQSIMIGTMNLEAESGWIKDGTGGRRFWGVQTGTIDIPGFKLIRDQLFAEAYARYKKGERPYLDQASVVAEARKEQHSRRQIDPWTEKIHEWLDHDDFGREREVVTSLEIWTDCLNGLEKQITRREQCRIANVMQYELKWEKGFLYHPTKKRTVSGFRRPEL